MIDPEPRTPGGRCKSALGVRPRSGRCTHASNPPCVLRQLDFRGPRGTRARNRSSGSGGALSASALALAGAAACVHAGWNLLLADASDPRGAAAVALPIGVVLLAPFAVAFWHVDSAAVPYILASAAFEAAYFWLLT